MKGAELPALKEHETVLTREVPHGWVAEAVVRPNSRALETYYPMTEAPELVPQLLQLRGGKNGALTFAETYGLPGGEIGNVEREMRVRTFGTFLKRAKSVLGNGKRSPARLFNAFAEAWPPNTTKFWISIDPRHKQKRQYNVIPSNLYNFIVLRVAVELSGGIEWRLCGSPRCTNNFPVGRGRGTTAEQQIATIRKKYCNDTCRKAAERARSKINA